MAEFTLTTEDLLASSAASSSATQANTGPLTTRTVTGASDASLMTVFPSDDTIILGGANGDFTIQMSPSIKKRIAFIRPQSDAGTGAATIRDSVNVVDLAMIGSPGDAVICEGDGTTVQLVTKP